jgi:hypothetical protein
MKLHVLALAAFVLILPSRASAQTPPVARPADSVAWDKTDAEIAAQGVDHFQVCLDTAPCVNLTLAEAKSGTSYAWKLPAMTVGPHTVTVQACGPAECSDPASLAFTLIIKPSPVSNIRIGGGQP